MALWVAKAMPLPPSGPDIRHGELEWRYNLFQSSFQNKNHLHQFIKCLNVFILVFLCPRQFCCATEHLAVCSSCHDGTYVVVTMTFFTYLSHLLGLAPFVATSSSLLGLLAKIMCSICSCQLNIWHAGHCPAPILN